jgi:hypothetical protein
VKEDHYFIGGFSGFIKTSGHVPVRAAHADNRKNFAPKNALAIFSPKTAQNDFLKI